jgi:pimeloyl-ACP methyl ester carboxylesterase
VTVAYEPQTVSFACEGYRLVGTLRQNPSGERADTGFVILNQGPLDRSGAHKISDRIARRLNALTCPTLQFDARGVGESEGDWVVPAVGEPIQALYKRIFDGAWIPDTLAAIEFLRSTTGVTRVMLIGMCGGASTALHAGAIHPSVAGMAMVGMPIRVQFDGSAVNELVPSFVQSETKKYLDKLLAAKAWKRFFTFRTDYRTLAAILVRRLVARTSFNKTESQLVSSDILDSFKRAVKANKKLLFVYSENDYFWAEFKDLFLPSEAESRTRFDLVTIEHANHTLTETTWQEQLYAALLQWASSSVAALPS